MKYLVRTLVAGLLTGLCHADLSAAELEGAPSGREIVDKVNARDEGVFVTRRMTMRMIDKQGKERLRDTFGYRRYYGDEKRSVIFYLSPANIKDTGFLTFDYADPSRDDDQWLYLPAARKTRRISASDRGDYFLGTDLTFDDMKKEGKIAVEDYTFTTIGEEEVDGRHCYIVESFPVDEATKKELGYGKVQAWIDSEIWMTRKSEFWDVRLNPLKSLRVLDIRQVDGIWTAHRFEVDNHKTGHKTVFEFAELDYMSDVPDDVFSERALERGVQVK